MHALEPLGKQDVQCQQSADQRLRDPAHMGRQSVHRWSDLPRQAVVPLHVQTPGRRKDSPRQLFRSQPVTVRVRGRYRSPRHRRRPHRQQRCASVVAGQRQGQVLGLSRQPAEVPESLGHQFNRAA